MISLVDTTTLSNEDLRKLIYQREQEEAKKKAKIRDEFIKPFNKRKGYLDFDKEIDKLDKLKAFYTIRYLSKNIPEQYTAVVLVQESGYSFMVPLTEESCDKIFKGIWLKEYIHKFITDLKALDPELYEKCQYYDLLETILTQDQIKELHVGSQFDELLITRDAWFGLKLISNTASDNKPAYQWFRLGQLGVD